ncbi:MAG: ABC transporter permease [Rubripirellula sp.]|nr:ABC transporter permease [Rubripirellula sp.]
MNPVIRREFIGILRSPKTFGMLLVLTALFSATVILQWPSDTSSVSGSKSLEVFRIFGYGLLAGVIFLVPAFPATSIVNEKNSKTLALLLNSPLSGPAIYLGKISGVLLFSLLVLLCSLPASAACFAMGGISLFEELGLLYLILFFMILQYSTMAMLISSHVQTSDAAVRITYTAVFGFLLITLIPAAFLRGTTFFPPTLLSAAEWLRCLSPLPAIMEVLGDGDVGSSGLQQASTTSRFLSLTFCTSLFFAGLTLSRLNYRIFDRSKSKGVITNDRELSKRLLRRLLYVVDPQRRKTGIPWFLNPVMVKEFRCRRFGRSQWLLRLIAACSIISMLLTFLATTSAESWGVATIGPLLVLMQVILVVVLTPSLASGLISGERDSGGWEILRMTPLSTFRVVTGKLLSVVWTLLLVLMATLPGYVMTVLIKPDLAPQIQMVLVCLFWITLQALAISAAVGSLFRYTAVSTSVTYVTVIACFLTPMLVWLAREAPFGHGTVEAALLLNPVGAALNVIGAAGFENYQLLPAAWWISGIVSAAMFALLSIQVWRLNRAV